YRHRLSRYGTQAGLPVGGIANSLRSGVLNVTDSEADAIFQGVFAEWSVNGSKRDYGWDYVVEVFRNRESTGFLFNGQLKGSRHTEYSADGSFISQELEIDSAH